ncbi:transport and Golgi organization protein 6 homolog isoform X2 [Argiope bruennichi]|uniref:transport and Golgi organization protein 6 homolog isoform X2 n=1 Tax=Argiope bruennichi TaxID=94029 RepID=UPI002494E8E4|nr:transport and Golgi organization protein 6 homolog isoform X2 [Argiope bruennichi]
MSAEESKIQNICNCLHILTNDIKITECIETTRYNENVKDSFPHELRRNVHRAFHKIENYSEVKAFVTEYIQPCFGEKCTTCDYLKFLQLCLVLLRLLKLTLSEESELTSKKSDASKLPIPKELLNMSQKNVLRKSLQFAVSLGILPNLLRGIGIPLCKRLKHAIILECFASESTLYQKHIQIAVCLDTLIGCLECEAMQSTILTSHGTDILAALLQLCHAPIKKVENAEELSTEFPQSDGTNHTEAQIINMMLAHRKYFAPHLETFLKQICPSLLMWELLLFQGIPIKLDGSEVAMSKSPLWLRKICNQLWTDMILQNQGIADLVQVVLDKAYDADYRTGKVDTTRIETVARLITYNPVRHISLADYAQQLSKQVFQLLHVKGSKMDGLFKYLACCIILQFCERDIKSAEQHFLVKLLKPLWNCVRQPTNLQVNVIVKEIELTTCIEDLHQIFGFSSHCLSHKYIKLLFPFSHCLCNMFFFLLRGKSSLKTKVKNLINIILKNATDEEALSLLHAVSFSNNKQCGVYITKVSFANGEDGGIVAVQKVEEDFPDEIVRYHAILDLLSELQNKNLNRSYILLVLKEFCTFHLESKDNVMDPENIKAGILFNALLQELSEWNVDIGEALMSNISEVIDILMTLLESICNCRTDATFYEKTLWVVLMILNSILESDDQLTAADWSSLKKCLPSLKKLQKSDIDSDLKEIIFSIIIHIATHGAACKNGIEIVKDFVTNFPDHASVALKPSEQSLLDLVEKFDRECNLSAQSIKSRPPSCITSSSETCSKATSSSVKRSQSEKGVPKHNTNSSKKSSDSAKSSKSDESASKKKDSPYMLAMRDARTSLVHIKGNGLISLVNLLKEKDEETLQNKKEILKILKKNLEDEDSHVYLPAIQGLSALGAIEPDFVLPYVLNQYQSCGDKHIFLKFHEVLLKICNALGDSLSKYKDILLHAYLAGTKRDDPQIRSSSLSNLGQACMFLQFQISNHWLQEILNSILSFLKTDPDLEVRRCAVMIFYLLLKGLDKGVLSGLENEMKTIYSQLKIIYNREKDDVLRQHSHMALTEINEIIKKFMAQKDTVSKEIRVQQ